MLGYNRWHCGKVVYMKRILFVCLGNICRSPTAQAVLQGMAMQRGIELHVDSAGTSACHAGEKPDSRSRAVAVTCGYSMEGQVARQVEAQDFTVFDYIFAMDKQNLARLQQLKPADSLVEPQLFLKAFGALGVHEVPDPYYGGQDGFETVVTLLEDACNHFLTEIEYGKHNR